MLRHIAAGALPGSLRLPIDALRLLIVPLASRSRSSVILRSTAEVRIQSKAVASAQSPYRFAKARSWAPPSRGRRPVTPRRFLRPTSNPSSISALRTVSTNSLTASAGQTLSSPAGDADMASPIFWSAIGPRPTAWAFLRASFTQISSAAPSMFPSGVVPGTTSQRRSIV
jgi:hypothetical protein